jgi:putative component of membrane protein insertase Oxa1/YidC/SpoIIIJ protein YidD
MIRKMKIVTTTNLISKHICKKTASVCIFILCCSIGGFTQNTDKYGLNEISHLFEVHEHKAPKYKSESLKPKNELEFLMASSFNIYKGFFSSQDNPSCVFHPSCSEFSVKALQQKGLLLGTLYTFDRLSRCHRFIKPDQYVFDPSKQRFYDPVR